MGMKKTFVTFALAGIFVLSLLTFVYNVQVNNDANGTIFDNSILNNTRLNLTNELSTYSSQSENQSQSQDTENPTTEGGSLLFISITTAGKVIKGMILGVYNVFVEIPSKMLGVPEVVVIAFTGIITILLILAAWRLYKAGE